MKYIFRSKVEENFTTLRNSCIQDSKLTWEARGVLHYLLSKPETWQTRRQDLIDSSPGAGKHVITRIFKELCDEGYIFRKEMKDENGRWVWITFVSDLPVFKEENMDSEKQAMIDEEMAAILGPEILERTRKIKESANHSKVSPEDLAKSAAGIGENDPTDGFPVHVKELLGEFISVALIRPTKRRKSDWIDTANEWREMGVKKGDIRLMFNHAREKGWDITRPGSITSAYNAIKIAGMNNKVDDSGFRVAK